MAALLCLLMMIPAASLAEEEDYSAEEIVENVLLDEEDEEIPLDPNDHRLMLPFGQHCRQQSQMRTEFIDGTVCFETDAGFRYALASN